MSVNIELPDWCEPYLTQPARYKVAHGGRGSAKTWSFGRMLLLKSLQSRLRVVCARELQNSIQDSSHQLLADQISMLGLGGRFRVLESRITSSTGSEFLFKGLRGMRNDAQQIKSLEGADICWVDEAQAVSAKSWETLTPTIRKPGAEIWVTMNPDLDTDPVYQLVKNPPPGSVVRQVNWDANPWFGQTSLPAEREWMLATDPDAYAHVWGGECRKHSKAAVLHGKWVAKSFEPQEGWGGPYQGADWGFASDPSAFVRCWIDGPTLYVEREAYGHGLELKEEGADSLRAAFDAAVPAGSIIRLETGETRAAPGPRQIITRGDPARPETIAWMRNHGYTQLVPAEKWPGSVEDGIAYLRGFAEIVIHPRCKHTIEEARLWSYKVDQQSGDILPVLVDRWNHCWDAVRYALAPIIRKRAAPDFAGQKVQGL